MLFFWVVYLSIWFHRKTTHVELSDITWTMPKVRDSWQESGTLAAKDERTISKLRIET